MSEPQSSEKKEPEVQKIDFDKAIHDLQRRVDGLMPYLQALEARIKALEDRWKEAVENLEVHIH